MAEKWTRPAEVVIVGAGPNGLMLAIELALAGARPIVLERLSERSEEPRANGLVGQVVRMLDRRGLYDRLAPQPGPPRPVPGFMFGAMRLELERLDNNPVYLLPTPQQRLEEVLQERALELGVEIRRGHEFSGLSQDAEEVRVEVTGPHGSYRIAAQYLVGADGGHSPTRKAIGVGFPGVTNDHTVSRVAHVSLPDGLLDPTSGVLTVPGYGPIPPFLHHRTERGLFVVAPFPGRPVMISAADWEPPGDEPMSLAELSAAVRRVLGVELELRPPEGPGPHQLRRVVGGNSRLADHYRVGRVLLVGDAAHVHSAIGGSGLNLGLQDAINLGWKLAGCLQGWGSEELLDSYEAERRPVGGRVVLHTQAQAALIAPGQEITALRTVLGELLNDTPAIQRLADLISGADIRYGAGRHRLTGRWAPDLDIVELGSGRSWRLAELARSARPLLLDLSGAGLPVPTPGRVDVRHARPISGAPAALAIRPDGYVAWAADIVDDLAMTELTAALASWFGVASADPDDHDRNAMVGLR